MIASNPNPPMTGAEILHFRSEMSRRLRGELSPNERQRKERALKTYNSILKRNGGRNPILGK